MSLRDRVYQIHVEDTNRIISICYQADGIHVQITFPAGKSRDCSDDSYNPEIDKEYIWLINKNHFQNNPVKLRDYIINHIRDLYEMPSGGPLISIPIDAWDRTITSMISQIYQVDLTMHQQCAFIDPANPTNIIFGTCCVI